MKVGKRRKAGRIVEVVQAWDLYLCLAVRGQHTLVCGKSRSPALSGPLGVQCLEKVEATVDFIGFPLDSNFLLTVGCY